VKIYQCDLKRILALTEGALAELLTNQKAVADLQTVFLAAGSNRDRLDFLCCLAGLHFLNGLDVNLWLVLAHILRTLLHHNYL
jgi:hypothetical protein